MSSSDFDRATLERRYDGPVPPWEDPRAVVAALARRSMRLHLNRRLALDYARALQTALTRAGTTAGAARLRHWRDAVRMIAGLDFHRHAHSRAAILGRERVGQRR